MDDVRIGRLLRALRRERSLRQVDVAAAAGVSQSLISLIERGHLAKLSIATLRTIFAVAEARFEGTVSWRGGAIDRLLDERHAQLVGGVARDLRASGWQVELEVTFSVYGERGSIDVVAHHVERGIVLVVEIKTELTSIEETIRRIDAKDRLAPRIVLDRFGWRSRTGARLLVVLDSSTNRRRVANHEQSLTTAFPDRGVNVRRWLRQPTGRLSGLLFHPGTNGRGTRQTQRPPVASSGAKSAPGTTPVGD